MGWILALKVRSLDESLLEKITIQKEIIIILLINITSFTLATMFCVRWTDGGHYQLSSRCMKHQAKTPALAFLELEAFLEFFEELLFFLDFFFLSELLRNFLFNKACRFLRLVNRIPKNMTSDPTNIALPKVYFNLFPNDPDEPAPKPRDRWYPPDPAFETNDEVVQRLDSDAEQLPLSAMR